MDIDTIVLLALLGVLTFLLGVGIFLVEAGKYFQKEFREIEERNKKKVMPDKFVRIHKDNSDKSDGGDNASEA